MAEWIVRVEAVNFAATIFDTNDLSTIRGGGLACLDVAQAAEAALANVSTTPPQLLVSGASQCAFRIRAGIDDALTASEVRKVVEGHMRAADGALRTVPHAYMMHVVDIAPLAEPVTDAEIERALATAEARNRTRQFRQWTQAPIAFSDNAKDADKVDRVRPATVRAHFPKGKVLIAEDDNIGKDKTSSDLVPVSPSVKARRDYGQAARQEFYRSVLKGQLNRKLATAAPGLRFSQSLQDIVADPPDEVGLSVRNKIAVVYADGNRFGKVRDKVGTIAFSEDIDSPAQEIVEGRD